MKIRVFHRSYGCDTGCCGHVVEINGKEYFIFSHPYGVEEEETKKLKEWAKNLVTEELKLHYPSCDPNTIDWDSLDISKITDNC